MRKIILTISLLAVSLISTSQNKVLSRLTVSENQFVDEAGDVVVLRGYSTSDPDKLMKDGKWEKAYFEEIRKWGANVVRFPIHPPRWRRRGQEEYLKLLDQGIEWATENSLYVILDWHSIGNLKSGLFHLPIYETDLKETFGFWQLIGKKYGDNPTVAFYELYNEPTTNNGKYGICTWAEWKAILEEMITIVRANGGKGIPLVAGYNWAYDLTEACENPIAAEGIGYVSHPYPQKRPKPWEEKWTEDWGKMKEKHPVILTEIGFAYPEEHGAHVPVISDESYGEAITNYSDSLDISYVVWVFDADWAPSLFSKWDYNQPTRHGVYFQNKLRSYGK